MAEFNVKCNWLRYKFNADFQPREATSSVTKKKCVCTVPPGITSRNSHSSNLVYLITCDFCHLQYVVETAHKLHEIFNGNKNAFCHPKKKSIVIAVF